MTAQIPDTVIYESRAFSIAGVNGNGLFTPAEIGLSVQMCSTACYRGHYCQYTVLDKSLYLTKLTVGLTTADSTIAEKGEGPLVFGRKPKRERFECEYHDGSKGSYWGDWFYEDFQHPVAYSGGLLIGSEFIREMYVHMGFHPAYKFRTVFELVFESGSLVNASNRSKEMQEFREMIANRPLSPADPKDEQAVKSWIERAFSLDYRL